MWLPDPSVTHPCVYSHIVFLFFVISTLLLRFLDYEVHFVNNACVLRLHPIYLFIIFILILIILLVLLYFNKIVYCGNYVGPCVLVT